MPPVVEAPVLLVAEEAPAHEPESPSDEAPADPVADDEPPPEEPAIEDTADGEEPAAPIADPGEQDMPAPLTADLTPLSPAWANRAPSAPQVPRRRRGR